MNVSGVNGVSGISGPYRVYFHLDNLRRPVSNESLPAIKRLDLSRQNKLLLNPLQGENTSRSWQINSFYSILNFLKNNYEISNKIISQQKDNIQEECTLCQKRRYICSNGETTDGISTIIPGKQSELRVQHHEAQHLHHARIKAMREGRVVISQHIFLQYSTCPECKRSYVSGGQAVTWTLSKQDFQQIIQQSYTPTPTYLPSGALNNERPEGKGINIDYYG